MLGVPAPGRNLFNASFLRAAVVAGVVACNVMASETVLARQDRVLGKAQFRQRSMLNPRAGRLHLEVISAPRLGTRLVVCEIARDGPRFAGRGVGWQRCGGQGVG